MEALIFGEEYFCYFKEEYIGIATFVDDQHIGECFTKLEVHKKRGLEEIVINPDYWVLTSRQSY